MQAHVLRGTGIFQVIASYGFMQEPNVPKVLGEAASLDL
jgi:hypothetical protein